MNSILRKLFISIIISSLAIPTAFASFEDVFEGHQNYEAINYLQENNVIQGYEDNTFKPAIKINRVEFLKIILEGSNVELDETENLPFKDTANDAWYSPYIKKAYAEGWVIGYEDGTFKPTQTINKVEAIKIIGEVQGWNLEDASTPPFEDIPSDAWYTPYVTYAKEFGFLEETGSTYSPSGLMTRAAISEVIYRTATSEEVSTSEETTENTEVETEETEEEEEEELTTDLSFNPVKHDPISKRHFSDINLDEDMPNIFYEDEVYIIKGEVTSTGEEEATVLIDEDTSDDDYDTISADLNGDNFEIAVHFTEPGNYYIGILAGDTGQTKVEKISVLPELPTSTKAEEEPSKASMLDIDHEDDQTFVSFSSPDLTIKKLTINQGSKKVTYISRQNLDEIIINYIDFEKFKEKETAYYIESAKITSENPLEISSDFIQSDEKTFEALTHTYSDIEKDDINTSPPSLLRSSQNISFSGSVKIDTKINGYIIKPDGFVDKIELSSSSAKGSYFSSETILKNGSFSFSYNPSEDGRYIVEIVDKNGLPTVNHPIYVGGGVPLIPDYFDLNTRTFYKGSVNLSSSREDLLDLVNESREDHGLDPIILNGELNDLAQGHSDDMAENDYFSHYNLSDETPGDRRVEAGITTSVSENIAQDVSIEFGHEGLMRSATHRSNILNEKWETVGIGVTKTDGYLMITEEFSTNAVVEADLEDYKTEVEEEISKLREDNGVSELTIDSSMEEAAEELNKKDTEEGITLDSDLFQDVLSDYNITGGSQAVGRTYNSWSSILSSILESDVVISSGWKKIGTSIEIDDSGNIHLLIILNDQS